MTIDYQVGELQTLNYNTEQFDAIALIYAHFPADIKSSYHQTLDKYLRTNGLVIFEAFSKRHIDYIAKNEKVDGPKDIAMLFSIDELKLDFRNYEIIELVEKEIELNEGLFHNGKGSVIRFVGRKNKLPLTSSGDKSISQVMLWLLLYPKIFLTLRFSTK